MSFDFEDFVVSDSQVVKGSSKDRVTQENTYGPCYSLLTSTLFLRHQRRQRQRRRRRRRRRCSCHQPPSFV